MAMKSTEFHNPLNATKIIHRTRKNNDFVTTKILAKFTKEPPSTPKQNQQYLPFIAPLAPHKNIHKPQLRNCH